MRAAKGNSGLVPITQAISMIYLNLDGPGEATGIINATSSMSLGTGATSAGAGAC